MQHRAATTGQGERQVQPQQPYTLVQQVPVAGGVLDLVCLQGDRMLRVWMPPGELVTAWLAAG